MHGGEGTQVLNGSNPSTSHQTFLFDDCFTLDLKSLQWTKQRQSLAPSPRKDHTGVAMSLKTGFDNSPHFVVFGGLLGEQMGVTNELHCLNLSASAKHINSWGVVSAKGSTPCPRRGHAAAVTPARVAAREGLAQGTFDLSVALASTTTTHEMEAEGELMFVFGGVAPSGTASAHFESMRSRKGQAAAAAAIQNASREVHNDTTILGDLCVYDGMQNAWRHLSHQTVGTPPQARFGHSIVYVAGRDRRRTPHLLICGGATWTQGSQISAGALDASSRIPASDTQAVDQGLPEGGVLQGGWHRETLGDMHMLDLTTLAWSTVDLGFIPFPPRLNHSCIVHSSVPAPRAVDPELAAATLAATKLLPKSQMPSEQPAAARVQIMVFGGMSSSLCDSTVWRGRVRRRRGQFFSFTDVVPKSAFASRSISEKATAGVQPSGKRILVPPASALPMSADQLAGVEAVYESDDDVDSDGINAADAEQLVARARELSASVSKDQQASLVTTRFVVEDEEEGGASDLFLTAASGLRSNPASPTKLRPPNRPSSAMSRTQTVGATNVFADIVASAGQEMADAVQKRLMALQKRVITLHSTLDHEMATRKQMQELASKLEGKLVHTTKELADTVASHSKALFSIENAAKRRVAEAEDRAAQAAADLKRVTSAAYLLQTAAEHRMEHLESIIVELQRSEKARRSSVDTYPSAADRAAEQAAAYAAILSETQPEEATPASVAHPPAALAGATVPQPQRIGGGGLQSITGRREHLRSAPAIPSVAPVVRPSDNAAKERLMVPAANV